MQELAPAELFRLYWRPARAAAYAITRDWAAAEDAAADGFAHALQSIHSLHDPSKFPAWLRTIVVRKARAAAKAKPVPLSDQLSHPNELPSQALERHQLAVLLQHAVQQLPERLREAVLLVHYEGYPPDAAARFLDIPPGTLRRRLHDARARLRAAVAAGQQQTQLPPTTDIYQLLRQSLALRPVPMDLTRHLKMSPESAAQLARLIPPPPPSTPIAEAIRQALPNFTDWPLDTQAAATKFFSGQPTLPPGFAEGRPGAYIRATHALVEKGTGQTTCEHLQASPSPEAFQAGNLQLVEVLDLTWMTARPLDLREVQQTLEQLIETLLPAPQIRFSPYTEPRYRAALQLTLSARAAIGGVLNQWPGLAPGVEAAHIRLFLESWAAAWRQDGSKHPGAAR
jgi:RNA polymerase sigma-70 factor (ECF subfamily)